MATDNCVQCERTILQDTSLNDFVDCVLAVHQLIAKMASGGPAGGHCGVGCYVPHLSEVHLGEVLEEWEDVAARSVGRGGLLPGCVVPLVLEHKPSNVWDEESRND